MQLKLVCLTSFSKPFKQGCNIPHTATSDVSPTFTDYMKDNSLDMVTDFMFVPLSFIWSSILKKKKLQEILVETYFMQNLKWKMISS